MIPRGADFPPDSAPPAKRRVPKTMRRERLALCRPLFVPSDFPEAGGRRSSGQPCCNAAQAEPKALPPHSLRAHDAGRVRPGHDPHGNSVDFIAFLRRLGPPPTRSNRLAARFTPRKSGNFSSSPKLCGRPRQSGKRPRFLQRLFVNFSTQKKRTGSVTSRFSPDTLSCSCFLSLEHFLRSFSPRLRRRGKRVSAFQVLKFFKACVPAV